MATKKPVYRGTAAEQPGPKRKVKPAHTKSAARPPVPDAETAQANACKAVMEAATKAKPTKLLTIYECADGQVYYGSTPMTSAQALWLVKQAELAALKVARIG